MKASSSSSLLLQLALFGPAVAILPEQGTAVMQLYPGLDPLTTTPKVTGTVKIKANAVDANAIDMVLNLQGLTPGATGGIHVHEGVTCKDSGGHFWTPKTDPDPWLNVKYTANGSGATTATLSLIKSGYKNGNMEGHAVVVHNAANERIACGVVGAGECKSLGVHKDLPNPPTDLFTFAKGTWIIPMDAKQNVQGSATVFNLHVYGYVLRLIWNDLKVHWAIRGCKQTNDIDFQASARQILPSWTPAAALTDFRSGAIIIEAPPYGLETYKQFVRDVALAPNPMTVYVLEEDNKVLPIRHTWYYKPKVAILGTKNAAIHTAILDEAKFQPGKHYEAIGTEAELLLSKQSCYTFISNPHDDLKISPERVVSVHKFTQSGGNFLAQCHGAYAYSAQGPRFNVSFIFNSSTAGQACTSDLNCADGAVCDLNICTQIKDGLAMSTGSIQQPDATIMQLDQALATPMDFGQGGSWTSGDVAQAEKALLPGRAWVEMHDGTSYKMITGVIRDFYDHNVPVGGITTYLAGHAYKIGSPEAVNAMRIYLNAAIVPASNRNTDCGLETKQVLCEMVGGVGLCTVQVPSNGPTVFPYTCLDNSLIEIAKYCDWFAACATLPAWVSQAQVDANKLSCFPDYCSDKCEPVWMNVVTKFQVTPPPTAPTTGAPTVPPTFAPSRAPTPPTNPTFSPAPTVSRPPTFRYYGPPTSPTTSVFNPINPTAPTSVPTQLARLSAAPPARFFGARHAFLAWAACLFL